jgi:hypothetical protein
MHALKDPDGTYSVRKFGGYLSLALLAYLIISFTIANKFKVEVPSAYWGGVYLIIAFYFVKSALSNLRFNTKVDDATSNKTEVITTDKDNTKDSIKESIT